MLLPTVPSSPSTGGEHFLLKCHMSFSCGEVQEAVDCALAVLSHSWWHHSVPAPTRGCGFPKDGVSVTGLGETAGRSPGLLLPFVEQTLIKKRAEGCSLPPPSPPSPTPLSLLLFFIFALGSIFLKTSLVIQSLPQLPNLHFTQEHQRCLVITTCLKEGK